MFFDRWVLIVTEDTKTTTTIVKGMIMAMIFAYLYRTPSTSTTWCTMIGRLGIPINPLVRVILDLLELVHYKPSASA